MNRAAQVIPLVLLVNASWALGQVFWKRAIAATAVGGGTARFLSLLENANFYFGVALSGLGALTWLLVLSKADLSYATPIAGAGILLAALFSWAMLGEPMSATRLAGSIVIAIGVALVARS